MTHELNAEYIDDLVTEAVDFLTVARLALVSEWAGAGDLLSVAVVLEHAEKCLNPVKRALDDGSLGKTQETIVVACRIARERRLA